MSQTTFTRYHPDTGEIHSKTNCHHSDYLANVGLYPDMAVVDQDCDLDLDYVNLTAEPLVTRRPALPGFDKLAIAADDVDEARLALAEPFAVEIDGQTYQVDEADGDGNYVLTLTSAMPATYKVSVKHFPYLDFEAEITAT
jgi:hypothetical protein